MKALSLFAACTGAVPSGEREPIKMVLIEEYPDGRDVLCTVHGTHQDVFQDFFRMLMVQGVKYQRILRAKYSLMQYLMRSGKFPDLVNELILHHVNLQHSTASELLGDTNSLIRRILFPKESSSWPYGFIIETNDDLRMSDFERRLREIGISNLMTETREPFRKMHVIEFQVLLDEAEMSKQYLQKILGVKQAAVSNLSRPEDLRFIKQVHLSQVFSNNDFLRPVPSFFLQSIGSSIESRTEVSGLNQRITHNLLPGNGSVDTEEPATAEPAAIDTAPEQEVVDFAEPDANSDLAHDSIS